jgi:Protein of unknown function (DUF1236)
MSRVALLTSVAALAVAIGGVPAVAQMKGDEKGGPPQAQGSPGSSSGGQSQQQPRQGAEKSEPGAKGSAGKGQPERGTAQTEGKDRPSKGTAEKAEPKASKGAEKSTEPKSTKGAEKSTDPKSTKGAEQSPEPKDKTTKGVTPGDKAPKGTAQPGTEPKDKAKTAEPKAGSGQRVQLSEQQRTNVGQTLTREKQLNRVTNVNFSINVGTRVPRSVRLVALPASVIALVPAYRSYQYFAVDDRICIVDPATYEIVEVITISEQTAGRSGPAHAASLVLTEEERLVILQEVDMGGGSTLALGALTEGAEVPRDVEIRTFPSTVLQKVPKVRDYKFFTTENRVAIVDPQGSKVALVIEQRR